MAKQLGLATWKYFFVKNRQRRQSLINVRQSVKRLKVFVIIVIKKVFFEFNHKSLRIVGKNVVDSFSIIITISILVFRLNHLLRVLNKGIRLRHTLVIVLFT